MTELTQQAGRLADTIIKELDTAKDGCDGLLLEWTLDRVWGHRIKNHIPKFFELYNYCVEHDYTSEDKAIWYGDLDVGVWVEPTDDTRKIIVMRNICVCRDDNIYVYIYDDPIYGKKDALNALNDTMPEHLQYGEDWFSSFLSLNVYEEETLAYDPPTWGDHRDIKHPSLKTLHDYGFKYGYGDARDATHNFCYEGKDGATKSATWTAGKIHSSLLELDFAYDNIVIRDIANETDCSTN